MNKRGSVPMLVTGVVLAVVSVGVYTVEATRAWLKEARLQTALDAGALYAAANISRADRDANVKAIVAATYNANVGTAERISESDVTILPVGTDKVQVRATAKHALLSSSLPFISKDTSLEKLKVVDVSSTANRTNTGIELALVIDTTVSMGLADGTKESTDTGGAPARIEFARRAALKLTSILYGGQTEYQPNLYVSVVPFNVAINIGNGTTQQGWLADYDQSWSGCVEARREGYDLREDQPSSGDSRFRRYNWPNTYDSAVTSSTNIAPVPTPPATRPNVYACSTNQDYSNTACMGNNDWGGGISAANKLNNALYKKVSPFYGYYGSTGRIGKTSPIAYSSTAPTSTSVLNAGPAFMCPTVPILPLTMDRATVERRINDLVGNSTYPYPFGFGTVIATGLQGAWYTLSPDWRIWPNPNPLRSNGTRLTPPSALPLAYDAANMDKVVLLLSDGDNNWLSARHSSLLGNQHNGTAGTNNNTNNTLTYPENRRTELFYNAYGTLSAASNRLGITIPNSATPPNPNTEQLARDFTTLTTSRSFRDRYGAPNTSIGNTAAYPLLVGEGTLTADEKLDDITLKLCTAMKAKGIIIYAVGIGVAETSHHDLLQACVSARTADRPLDKYVRTTTAAGLEEAFTQIANELATLRLTQ